jgi:hypothetical protein
MTCPSVLLRTVACSITVVVAWPCSAEERCLAGPVGPRDLDYLAACRPAPASAAQREAIFRTLPAQGAVTTLTSKERAKIETLGSVLRLHAREDVYDVRVIDVPEAGLWNHGRAVLLISLPALRLLKAEQLQALAAHEIGHEYWWDVWEAARRRDEQVRLRGLEGQCDAVAVLTLTLLGIPAERLSSALGAVHHFNRRRFRIPRNANYPTLRERREIVKRFSPADGGPLGSLSDQEAQAASIDALWQAAGSGAALPWDRVERVLMCVASGRERAIAEGSKSRAKPRIRRLSVTTPMRSK